MKVSLPGRSPDFIGFGVHRSGSTWLNGQLRQHPDVWTPPHIKEVHYFDERHLPQHARWHRSRLPGLAKLMRRSLAGELTPQKMMRARRLAELATSDRDDDWYRCLFGLAPVKVARVGETTPAYSLLDVEGMAHIKAVNPDVRLFIVFRNPAERIWSHVKLALKSEITKDPSILQDRDLIAAAATKKGVIDRTQYRKTLETIEQVFPEEQILVSFYDKVALEPVAMLAEIAKHIDVDPEGFPLEDIQVRQHTSPPGEIPDWFRKQVNKAHGAEVEWLADRFGSYPASWLD